VLMSKNKHVIIMMELLSSIVDSIHALAFSIKMTICKPYLNIVKYFVLLVYMYFNANPDLILSQTEGINSRDACSGMNLPLY